jgi:methyl-accepting chemotaxis protein
MKSFIWRRRKFIINRDFQFKLLFASLFYVFLCLAVLGSGLFIPLFTELDQPGATSLKLQQAAKMVLYLHENFWPAVLLSLVLIGFLSIRTSHRIAGPLYRIILVLESLKKGKVPKPVHGRKGDHLEAEIKITNQMIEGLRIHVGEIQKAQADLNNAIAACSKVIGHASSEELTNLMKDLSEKRDKLEERISYFKIEL